MERGGRTFLAHMKTLTTVDTETDHEEVIDRDQFTAYYLPDRRCYTMYFYCIDSNTIGECYEEVWNLGL